MYIIVVYDVDVSRVNKINKFLKQYLYWRQNSVFEGELTKSQMGKIEHWLNKNLKNTDKAVVYILPSNKNLNILYFGPCEKIERIL